MVTRLDAFPAGELKPALGGLLSAATIVEHGKDDLSWGDKSYTFDSLGCPAFLSNVDVCATGAQIPVGESVPNLDLDYFPFGIIAQFECITTGFTVEERNRIVRRQLEVGTQKAVEHELWTGAVGLFGGRINTPYLTDGRAVNVTPSPVNPTIAVAVLEQALADCGLGAQGLIHMTRAAGFLAVGNGALKADDDGALSTVLGTPVAAGVGYRTDTTPQVVPGDVSTIPPPMQVSPTSSNVYAFATGPVTVHLGPIEIFEPYLDYENNHLTVTAGRPAAVYWDSCCIARASVNLNLPSPV